MPYGILAASHSRLSAASEHTHTIYSLRRGLGCLGMKNDSKKSARAEQVRRDDERFRSLADAAPVMLWVTEPDGAVSFLSRAWHEFTGQTEAAGLGDGWLDAVHPDDRAISDRRFSQANATQSPFEIEYRLRRQDGTYRWAIDTGRPRFAPGGEFLGYVGSVIDITERKLTELAARRGQEQLEILSNTVPALISYVGPDRCYITCNAEYSKWFGLSHEDIVGRPMRDVLGDDAWRVVGPHIEKAFTGEPSEYEAEVNYRHGGRRAIYARYTPHRDATGATVGVVCLVTDITSRTQASHARTRLAAVVDWSEDAIVTKSLDGIITTWNRGAAKLVRLQRRGSRRATRYDADSGRAASRGGENPRTHPKWRNRRAL